LYLRYFYLFPTKEDHFAKNELTNVVFSFDKQERSI
jgi:hypothetical protein